MCFQEVRHREGVFGMLLLAKRERLQPLEEQEGIERAQRRAEVAQAAAPCTLRINATLPMPGNDPERIPEFQAVIARVRLGKLGKLAVVPFELAAESTMTPPMEVP